MKNPEQIAAALIHGKPLSFRALDDGSMVVINGKGQKLTFSASEVTAAQSNEKSPSVPSTVAQTAPVRSHHKKK